MRTQLIEKKAQIGSKISCTLTTGNQVSGLLTEIGHEHITLNGAKGETTILVEAIIAVQRLDNPGDESVAIAPTPSQAEIRSAKLELKPPNLTLPAQKLRGWQKTDVAARWLQIKNRYRTRTGEEEKTPVENLSIRLYSADEFEEIENPYAAYAEGGVVGEPKMFFGREELIRNIAHAIQESRLDSKCIVVFGQKRSGKSSVLHHLKASLQKDSELLILDLGNLGSIQEEDSSVPLLHQILKRILTVLEYAIEDRVDAGFTSLALPIPDDSEFYGHPAPLQCFQDTFERLKRQVARHEDWRGVRAVLLIDEFQYIYARIVAGKIPESFMQNWKALLQANYFSAVLVGQDVMPKFKERFPNEFGTTQDERVTYLTQGDARRLVDEPIRIGGPQGESRYREQAIERILELTAGSPFYIQIVCNRLVEYMNSKHAALVTAADVEHVKNELIAGVNALGLDKFDNLINSGDTSADAISDEDARKVLKVIADNSRTGLCHRDTIVCETHLPLDTILNELVKRDVVERREESYQIQVGLFKEWLIVNG